jgi:hypothetical protein
MKKKAGKLVLCVLTSAVALLATSAVLTHMDAAEENYDYSGVRELAGTVIEVHEDYDVDTGSSYTETVELENGQQVSIGTGGIRRDSVGDEVAVYTDGTHYSFTERGIALDNTGGIFWFLFACLLIFASAVPWCAWFGRKAMQ